MKALAFRQLVAVHGSALFFAGIGLTWAAVIRSYGDSV